MTVYAIASDGGGIGFIAEQQLTGESRPTNVTT